jgi:hypothetical protein
MFRATAACGINNDGDRAIAESNGIRLHTSNTLLIPL